eukprot:TRINITY_DN2653_c0_g1_i1.p1 TRINITY_DN2653_c0_g1~~TRINITY_DN2653_c0_g1_i1.p1  ORF type:complete len:725 (-),score=183.12 TRINITY_DN2653_c0_g1_i1:24-2198(-)
MDSEVLDSAKDNQSGHSVDSAPEASSTPTGETVASSTTTTSAEDSQEVKESQKGQTSSSEKENTENQTEAEAPFKTANSRGKAWKKASKKKKQAADAVEPKDKQQWPTPIEASESPKSTKKTTPASTTPKKGQKKGVNWVPLKDAIPSQTSEESRGQPQSQSQSQTREKQSSPQEKAQTGAATQTGANPPARTSSSERGQSSYRGGSSSRGGAYRGRGGRGGYRQNNQRFFNNKNAAVPEPKALDAEALKDSILKQFEYYFSTDNLCHDIYLRKNMNAEGWVSIDLFLGFPRVQALSKEKDLILEVLKESPIVEVNEGTIRRKDGWKLWLFPPVPSDATPKPNLVTETETKEDQASDLNRVKEGTENLSDNQDEQLIEFDESLLSSFNNEFDDEEVKDLDDQHISNLIIITQSSEEVKNSSDTNQSDTKNEDLPADVLSIINDGLLVYEQNLSQKKPSTSTGTAPTITTTTTATSTGSSSTNDKPKTSPQKKSGTGTKGKVPPPSPQRLYPKDKHALQAGIPTVGWVMDPSASAPKKKEDPAQAQGQSLTQPGSSPTSDDPNKVPYFPHPSHALLQENGFIQHQYDKYHDHCLKERKQKGIGKSQEMNTLFRFWSHFLRTHYNETMYKEMKKFALEDAEANYRYGMECLFRYFSYGLEKRFRRDLFNDFQEFTLRDYNNGQLYGLEKFWAYLKYRKEKDSLTVNPDLGKILDNYKSLKDFRPQV